MEPKQANAEFLHSDEDIAESVHRLLDSSHKTNRQQHSRTRKSRVSAAQILELQSNDCISDRYVVVDVRSQAETDVSIIPGAITKTEFEQNPDQHTGKAVIAYCTIGFRSGMYVWRLKRKGWNAWNYRGSMLDWCREGLPLETLDGLATKQVHTYSRWFSVPSEYSAVY